MPTCIAPRDWVMTKGTLLMQQMNHKTKEILNDASLVASRDARFDELRRLFGGQRPDRPFIVKGICGTSRLNLYEQPEEWLLDVLDSLAEQAESARDSRAFQPLCLEFGPYGVHFIDKLFGAEVRFNADSGQWYNLYLESPIGSLEPPDIDSHPTWSLAKRATEAFLRLKVSLPVFGLPTIASALNIAVNLYGDKILLALYDEPEKALHDLRIINDLLCELHRWYLDRIPMQQLQPVISFRRTQPPGFGQLCGCTTQLLSPELYRDFVAPLDSELLAVYPQGGMIHLCGSHAQHIPAFREMPELRAIQVNDRAAADLELYFNGSREDQILYVNPCPEMPLKKALEITGGERLVIMWNPSVAEFPLH